MPDKENIRALAVDIMTHLEDAHTAAVYIQGPETEPAEIASRLRLILEEIREVEIIISTIELTLANQPQDRAE